MIKIRTMERTQEDEKSKSAALKASEDKLTIQIEQLKKQIKDLQNDAEILENDKQNVDEAFKKLQGDYMT